MRTFMPALAGAIALTIAASAAADEIGQTTYTRFVCKETEPFLVLVRTPLEDQAGVVRGFVADGVCSLRRTPFPVTLEEKVVEATEVDGNAVEIWRVTWTQSETPVFVTLDARTEKKSHFGTRAAFVPA